MKRNLGLVAIVLIFSIISGCGPEVENVFEDSPLVLPAIDSDPAEELGEPSIKPTETGTTPTEPTNTDSFQVYSDRMVRDCVRTTENPSLAGELKGSLFVDSLNVSAPSYLLDMSTGEKTLLGRTFGGTVSKSGRFLAYWDLDKAAVVIADGSGNAIKEVSDSEERLTPVHWLDDQRLLLSRRRGERDGPYVPDSLVMMDIFDGDVQEWLPDYPNLDTWFSPRSWQINARFLVNPDLTHVVYQAKGEDSNWLSLWDIKGNREVAKIFGTHNDDTPWWSPDGNQFVTWGFPQYKMNDTLHFMDEDGTPYIAGGDLYAVDTMGNIKRLTYFTTTNFAVVSNPVWSPDGKFIAFMVQISPDNKSISNVLPEFSIVDLETGLVTNLCISGYGLTWSPDGKYILINQGPNEGKEQNEVYLIDREKNLTWKVAENAEGRGWMSD